LKFISFLGFLGVWRRQENFLQPLLKLSSSKLKSFKRGWGNFFYTQPPTFNAESGRLNAKNLCSACVGASKFKAWKLVEGLRQFFLRSTCFGTFQLRVQKLHLWLGWIFWHLASNFWCQTLEAKHKKICVRPILNVLKINQTHFFAIDLSWIPQATCSRAPWEAKANVFVLASHGTPKLCVQGTIRGQTQDFLAWPPTCGT
jgi:hypothetical protein